MRDNASNSKADLKLIHDHAWNHFELYSKQRVDLFKNYLAFFTLFFAGIYHTKDFKLLGIMLPITFLFVTLIFYLIERRNKEIVKRSKDALRKFEKEFIKPNDDENEGKKIYTKYKIFRSDYNYNSSSIHHGDCYKAIFFLGTIISLFFLIYNMHICGMFSGWYLEKEINLKETISLERPLMNQ